MPTSALEAVLYVFLLFPGIAFTSARERHRPITTKSVLRETAAIVLSSAALIGVIFTAVLVAGFFVPDIARWLKDLSQDSGSLLERDSQFFFSMMIGLLLASIALGWLAGSKAAHQLWLKVTFREKAPDLDQSLWSTAFRIYENSPSVMVALQLKSGVYLEGRLHSWDRSGDESPTRSLMLTGDIMCRMKLGEKPEILDEAILVVHDSEIDFMVVNHMKAELPAPVVRWGLAVQSPATGVTESWWKRCISGVFGT